ncbi:hypothetical protein M0R19_02795 [Candidatus Pacearchaeota archaeon]|nr:hypothetical protein [Candidatus Pacearchaeota archaeon]
MTTLKNFLLGSAICTLLLNGKTNLSESKKYNFPTKNSDYIEYNLNKKETSNYSSHNLENQKFIPEKELTNLIEPKYLEKVEQSKEEKSETKKGIKKKRSLENKIVKIIPPTVRIKGDIDINPTLVDYENSVVLYMKNYDIFNLFLTENAPALNGGETTQILDIMDTLKGRDLRNITSFDDFNDIFKTLSENQKIVLSAIVSNEFYLNYYNKKDNFVCRQIGTIIEKTLNKGGVRAAALSSRGSEGIAHMYNIAKLKNGTAVINSGNIFMTRTKNIEKTLEAYQRSIGQFAFQHFFYENNELKYALTTKDGNHFLDFVEYDPSLKKVTNYLVGENNPSDMDFVFNIKDKKLQSVKMNSVTLSLNKKSAVSPESENNGDYINSAGINAFGIFGKVGELSSPSSKMLLFHTGYRARFIFPKIILLDSTLSFAHGDIAGDGGFDNIHNNANAFIADLFVSTDNKKGFNASSRLSANVFNTPNDTLFGNLFLMSGGISYKIPVKNMMITPYLNLQASLLPENIDIPADKLMFDELRAGINFNAKFPKEISFSFEPYYVRKLWEDGFYLDTKFKSKHTGLNAGFYLSKSSYDFAPDRAGFYVGGSFYINPIGFNVNYRMDSKNYDGELTHEPSLSLEGFLKF